MSIATNTTTTNQKARIMTKQQKYLLLTPLQPSFFGYEDAEIRRMVSELGLVGIKTLMVDTEKEVFFYGYSTEKESLEMLCTNYSIQGLLVEMGAVYDQVIQTEIV